METVGVRCGHAAPDMCPLLGHVEDPRVVRGASDPDPPRADRCTDIGGGATCQSASLDPAACQEAA